MLFKEIIIVYFKDHVTNTLSEQTQNYYLSICYI
jgi:hypothetical protein